MGHSHHYEYSDIGSRCVGFGGSDYDDGPRHSGDYYIPRNQHNYYPTYGTYVWEPRKRRDAGDCLCTCCPHSYAGARRAAGEMVRDPPRQSPKRRGPPPALDSQKQKQKQVSGLEEVRPSKWPTTIEVLNKGEPWLQERYGNKFSMQITRRATTGDIIDFLAPNRNKYKIMVHWDNQSPEMLDDRTPMREIRRYATHLEVEKKKHVHWA